MQKFAAEGTLGVVVARLAACHFGGLVAAYFVFLNIHPYLAVTHRVNTNVLVVEGAIQRYAIRAGAEEFKNGSYERIFTTGGPQNGNGGYINDYYTSASIAADNLKKFGIRDDLVQMVPSRVIARERTYSSAIALRDWFREHNITNVQLQCFNGSLPMRGEHSFYIRRLSEKCHCRYHRSFEPRL